MLQLLEQINHDKLPFKLNLNSNTKQITNESSKTSDQGSGMSVALSNYTSK